MIMAVTAPPTAPSSGVSSGVSCACPVRNPRFRLLSVMPTWQAGDIIVEDAWGPAKCPAIRMLRDCRFRRGSCTRDLREPTVANSAATYRALATTIKRYDGERQQETTDRH